MYEIIRILDEQGDIAVPRSGTTCARFRARSGNPDTCVSSPSSEDRFPVPYFQPSHQEVSLVTIFDEDLCPLVVELGEKHLELVLPLVPAYEDVFEGSGEMEYRLSVARRFGEAEKNASNVNFPCSYVTYLLYTY